MHHTTRRQGATLQVLHYSLLHLYFLLRVHYLRLLGGQEQAYRNPYLPTSHLLSELVAVVEEQVPVQEQSQEKPVPVPALEK